MLWKPITEPGFENLYEISDTGQIRRTTTGHILKQRKHNQGYVQYCLSDKGKYVYRLAHVLVAKAFIPNPEHKRTVNHKDCDKQNNQLNNLEWMTHGENHQHAFANGRENPNAFELGINKLSVEDVKYIRDNYKSGDKIFGLCPLARKFSISPPCARKVVQRKSYKSIL